MPGLSVFYLVFLDDYDFSHDYVYTRESVTGKKYALVYVPG